MSRAAQSRIARILHLRHHTRMTDDTTTLTRRTALQTISGVLAGAGIATTASAQTGGKQPTDDGVTTDPAITTGRLLDAIEDWRNDEVSALVLLDIIKCWREEWSLSECIAAWRTDDINADALLYIRDLIRADYTEADA